MKKAVVFYGSMREIELGSKSWHVLGKDVDYFIVTWDVVNAHFTDKSSSYKFDLSKFPVPVKSSIIVNFQKYNESLASSGLTGTGMLYVLYHWSLIRNLPDIHSYDSIIIARPDMFCARLYGIDWEPVIFPGKVTFSGIPEFGVNDWIVTTDLAGLDALYELYYNGMQTKDFLDEFGEYKIIHHYLADKANQNPEKFFFGVPPGGEMLTPMMYLIRPNTPDDWKKISYGPTLAYLLIRHACEYEMLSGSDLGVGKYYNKSPGELAIDAIRSGTDFNL